MRDDERVARDALVSASRALELEPASACLLDASGVILSCNRAWDAFAEENGGAPAALGRSVVGRPWLSFLQGAPVAAAGTRALAAALAGTPRQIDGQCNSPTTARFLTTSLTPVWSGRGEAVLGVALIHSITRTLPIAQVHPIVDLDPARFIEPADGLIHMCASCRRVRRVGEASHQRWEFVPALVAQPRPDVTHGYCETCFRLQFPDRG